MTGENNNLKMLTTFKLNETSASGTYGRGDPPWIEAKRPSISHNRTNKSYNNHHFSIGFYQPTINNS